jgi:hypothetical protein
MHSLKGGHMAGKDIITMSQKELKKLHIIRKVLDKALKQIEATELLGLCERQIRRIVKRVKEEGDKGVIHKSRGNLSHNRIPEKTKQKALNLYRNKYKGFGPLLFSEKLFEIDKIRISDETLRNWLIESKEWAKKRKHRKHLAWRERKHRYGEMEQVDGSHHDWFESRGPKCVLMGYIDDAKSRIFARFHEYEGTLPFMDSFKRYAYKYGLPHSLYIDKHTTYKSTKIHYIKDELQNKEPLSEVGRALNELGVEVIYANSPQAKGRIERLFRTFQDRVIKEMRLRGIKSIEEANKFLEYYLPIFNKRFSVEAIEKGDLHRKVSKDIDLDSILCIKTARALRNDFTVAHNNKLYQIMDNVNTKEVTVEERINGRLFITHNQIKLNYKEITNRPEKKVEPRPYTSLEPRKRHIPPPDHPWRNYPHNSRYQQKEEVGQEEKELLLTLT